MPEISVIVPVYKTEKFLSECIRSILLQTFSDLEVILIDDGSPDGCGKICEHFVEEDSRVVVIHTENGGVSRARNIGIKKARGKYVAFVDSDDKLIPEAYEKLLALAKESNSDVTYCDFFEEYENNFRKRITTFESADNWHDTIVNMFSFGPYAGSVWNMLIKTSLLKENSILFNPEFAIGEDYLFSLNVYISSERIAKINEPLYIYRRVKPLRPKDNNKIARDIKFMDNIYSLLDSKGLLPEFKNSMYSFFMLIKTDWIMSKEELSFYYDVYPEANKYVDGNQLLGPKMKFIFKMYNKKMKKCAMLLVKLYKLLYQ